MNRLSKTSLLLCLLCVLPASYAAEMNLNTFLGASPLKDLDVELDGSVVGVTGDQGDLSAKLSGGPHRLRLMKKEAVLAEFSFDIAEDESADLSIAFSDFEKKPEITFDKYDAASALGGAPGVVEGYITDAEGYALPGATVRANEAGIESVSNEDGAFRLEIPRGTYTLTVSHPEHETATQAGLKVRANLGVATQVALRPKVAEFGGEAPATAAIAEEAPAATEAGVQAGPQATITTGADGVQEITVVGTYRPTEKTTADIERFSVAVTDAISVDELLRFGDSDVAAALKRIVGISVSDGKYAVVRGLDGRYIAATLNGALMPGTDPFRRDVQLDLFPADILGGIEIQKNSSADLPGETTGGIIKMVTRGVPDGYVNKLSASIGYVDGVTGERLASYEGSDTDDLGFDDGLRKLPGAIRSASNNGLNFSICQISGQTNCVERAEAGRLATLLPNIYRTDSKSAAPDFGLSYTLGNVFERDIGEIGLYGTASFDSSSSSREDAFIDNNSTSATYIRDQVATTASAYFVGGLKTSTDAEYQSKTIVLRNTEDTVQVESGQDKLEERRLEEVVLEWEERQFLGQQFSGEHFLFDGDQRLEWRAGASQTRRDSPDRRSYLYANGALALSNFERSYSELVEDGVDVGLDYFFPVTFSDQLKTELSVGFLGNVRDRDVDLIRIGLRRGSGPNVALNQDVETVLAPENFLNDGLQLVARTIDTDSYIGEQESFAGYVSSKTDIGDDYTVVFGLRQDEFTQELRFPNAMTSESRSELESNELLPSMILTYRASEQLQFRGGYAGTVSRPNLTELAPSVFYDERGREFLGCPSCQASTIDNFDFRAEYYFADKDSVSIAVFTKEIDQPLERSILDGSGSSATALTFRNAESATVSGIELDGSKTFLDTAEHLLVVGANFSFIESEVELDAVSQQLEIDPKRDLQGQSPFLANLQISWDYLPWEQKVTLLANYFDDRIDAVTRGLPPIEEAGRLLINLNYEKQLFANSKLSFKVKNLLDENVEYTQAGRAVEGYKEGLEASLGYSVNFD